MLPLLQAVAAMTEWPPFVIESPAEDPLPPSGWEEVVFELEDLEAGSAAVPAAVGAASRGAG